MKGATWDPSKVSSRTRAAAAPWTRISLSHLPGSPVLVNDLSQSVQSESVLKITCIWNYLSTCKSSPCQFFKNRAFPLHFSLVSVHGMAPGTLLRRLCGKQRREGRREREKGGKEKQKQRLSIWYIMSWYYYNALKTKSSGFKFQSRHDCTSIGGCSGS